MTAPEKRREASRAIETLLSGGITPELIRAERWHSTQEG
jgi:hypothetical protein